MKTRWQDMVRRFASITLCFGMVFGNMQVSAIAQDSTPIDLTTENTGEDAANEQTTATTDAGDENASSETSNAVRLQKQRKPKKRIQPIRKPKTKNKPIQRQRMIMKMVR